MSSSIDSRYRLARPIVGLALAGALLAGCGSADDAPIQVSASDLRRVPDEEVRVGQLVDFYLGIAQLDADRVSGALCEGYATDDQVEQLLAEVALIPAEDRYRIFEDVGTEPGANPIIFRVGLGDETGLVETSVTTTGIKCINSIESDNAALEALLDPAALDVAG